MPAFFTVGPRHRVPARVQACALLSSLSMYCFFNERNDGARPFATPSVRPRGSLPAGFLHRRRRRCPRPTTTSARRAVDMILLHYTGMQAARRRCNGCARRRAKCRRITWCSKTAASCNACRRKSAPGTPAFRPGRGETDINSCSVGIEIVNPGHEFGYRDFPLRQIAAVIALCRSILSRHGPITPDRMLAHSDVAPKRKQDPGEKFPWALLGESGIGHWVRPAVADARRPRRSKSATRARRSATAARAGRLRLRRRGDRQL